MLVWACVGVMVMRWWSAVGAVHIRSSDPVLEAQVSQPQLDPSTFLVPLGNPDTMEMDIPGAPLTPDDFMEGNEMEHKDWDPNTKADPIELAKLFQGDISLMTLDEYYDLVQPSEPARSRNAMQNLDERWTNGVIPYVISSKYERKERAIIATAMKNYHDKTCIRFVPRTGERDYIHIIRADGCSSSVGRRGGAQAVSLGYGCIYVGIVMHELMHAAGFWHEQSRQDRDEYITINTVNIQAGMEYNFQKYQWGRIQDLGVDYDLGSIMHYGAYAFAKDRSKPTIIPRFTGSEIGQRRAFSPKDSLKLRLMYNCDNSSVTVVTEAPGKDKCRDHSEHCKTWAGMGECDKNPTWMHGNCRMSCKKCGSDCSDSNKHCPYWQKQDQCRSNPSYMKLFCKKSCGICHVNAVSMDKCQDEHEHCQHWANINECRVNPSYMLSRCRKACGKC